MKIIYPAYLNSFGELHNINFSKLLKDALLKIASKYDIEVEHPTKVPDDINPFKGNK